MHPGTGRNRKLQPQRIRQRHPNHHAQYTPVHASASDIAFAKPHKKVHPGTKRPPKQIYNRKYDKPTDALHGQSIHTIMHYLSYRARAQMSTQLTRPFDAKLSINRPAPTDLMSLAEKYMQCLCILLNSSPPPPRSREAA